MCVKIYGEAVGKVKCICKLAAASRNLFRVRLAFARHMGLKDTTLFGRREEKKKNVLYVHNVN